MNVDAYLERINYDGPRDPTFDVLRELQRAHLMTVPFENLDIHLGRLIVLDVERLFDKIVVARRGGFCYELNGLFWALLRELGFDVTLLSARVSDGQGGFGPEFDHLVLLVRMGAEAWLADVGFGATCHAPLLLADGSKWEQAVSRYRLTRMGEAWTLLLQRNGGPWAEEYVFTLQPRAFDEFSGMCHYHQSSPDSHFTQGRICTLNMPDGTITLTKDRFVVTQGDQRDEQALTGEAEFTARLREHFGIVLDADSMN